MATSNTTGLQHFIKVLKLSENQPTAPSETETPSASYATNAWAFAANTWSYVASAWSYVSTSAKPVVGSARGEAGSLIKFIYNHPTFAVKLTYKLRMLIWSYLSKSKEESGALFAQEFITVLKALKPNIHSIIDALTSSNHTTTIDELYEIIKPLLDNLLEKNIANYGVTLKDLKIHEQLDESYIKKEVLPIFIICRDIPKFCRSIKEKNFLHIIKDTRAQLFTRLETDLHSELRKHLVAGTDGIYTITTNDAAVVSQIKKILNAFTYAERIITFVNDMDLNPDQGFRLEELLNKKGDKQVEYLSKVVWYLAMKDSEFGNYLHFTLDNIDPKELNFIHKIEQTINCVRQFQSSLLEIDIPILHLFKYELTVLDSLLSSLPKSAISEAIEWMAQKVGNVGQQAGTFVEHLKPSSGKRDFSFLITHLGLLPGYLDELTRRIYAYGAGQPKKKLALNEAETEVFKNAAIKLFRELSNFHDFFFWQKAYSSSFPIRKNVDTIGQEVYQQSMRVKEATGETVACQLSKVKNEIFINIICEADKLELYFGLAPGVLTKPLMLQLNDSYQSLVLHANSIVDLAKTYPDLLQLDNTSFLTKRLQKTVQHKKECQLALDKAEKAKQDLDDFLKAIDKISKGHSTLHPLYQSFKPYVMKYDPSKSILLDNYCSPRPTASPSKQELEAMELAVQNLCDKDIANFRTYVSLAESRLTELSKQVKGKLYPLSHQKPHSVFKMNESNWLIENRSSATTSDDSSTALPKQVTSEVAPSSLELHWLIKTRALAKTSDDLSQEQPFIEKLDSLTIENRAELYNYHSIRVLTLKHISKELDLFLHQLSETDWSSKQKKINAIIERYRVLQPYFVDSIAATKDRETDNSFVTLLDQLSNAEKPEQSAVLKSLDQGMNRLKQQIDDAIKSSESRQLIFKYAHNTVREKQQVFTLPIEKLVARQNKWIVSEQLSKTSVDMYNALVDMLAQFDPSLKLKTPKKKTVQIEDRVKDIEGAPFPEMEDDLLARETPWQVSWIKRMLNVTHYIYSNFDYLESLDRDISKKDITKSFLKGPLIEGIYQIQPFIELTKAYQTLMELMREPLAEVFLGSLKSGYNDLLKTWEKVQRLYFISSDKIKVDNAKPVDSQGFWYSLVSLMVLPEHLEHASAKKAYTHVDAEMAQKRAKETAQYIEQVMEEYQAGQYFSLLMKSPYIIFRLKPQLTAQLTRLTDDINRVTLAHLQDIQATLHSILIETDTLEMNLGLRVGLISQPTKLIIDKIFNSFLEPLSIKHLEYVQLVTATSSFTKRTEVNQQRQKEVKRMLESENRILLTLDNFLNALKDIKEKLEAKKDISIAQKEQFKALYWSVYPLLQSQQSHYQLSLDQRDKSVILDEFCNQCLTEQLTKASTDHTYHYNRTLTNVLPLTLGMRSAKIGNIKSLEMREAYLKTQSASIFKAEIQFKREEARKAEAACIANTFDTTVKLICKQSNNFTHLKSKCEERLQQSLESRKEDILKKVSTLPSKNVEEVIRTELRKQSELFSQDQYLQLAHLDSILSRIGDFLSYCEREGLNPTYESTAQDTGTLSPKIELLNRLKEIVTNNNKTPEQQILQLKVEAKKNTFYTILMSHDNRFKFEFKTLKRLFLNLFHCIFNFFGMTYRPSDFYTALNNTIQSESSSFNKSTLANSGFFSARQSDKPKDATPILSDQSTKPGIS